MSKRYEHPKWIEKREEILKLRNYTCQDCTDRDVPLQVHHGYYELGLQLWEYDNDTLWCLCIPCHERWGIDKRQLQKELARINFADTQRFDQVMASIETYARNIYPNNILNLYSAPIK